MRWLHSTDSDYSILDSVGLGEFDELMTAGGQRRAPPPKKRKPRQEISACLKWILFLFNFVVFLIGVAILALGVYLFIKDYTDVKLFHLLFNPAILISVIGFIICIVSLFGSLGALRDNIFLLRVFSFCVFLCYVAIVGITFLLFVLFMTEHSEGVSAHTLLTYAIKNYHNNRNLAEIVDSLQENLECCGVSSVSQGYRDWNLSYQFNCTKTNPMPEKCGVPFSCCRKSVISEAAGSSNPLLPAMRSLECWQNALQKRPQELEHDLYTRGCLGPLKVLFETHAIHIGAAVGVIIIPVLLSVCLTSVLSRQIDYQRYLLDREAKRNERRLRRERQDKERRRRELAAVEEGVVQHAYDPHTPPKLPDNPPPTRPPTEHKRKSRTTSSSPTRGPPKKQTRKRSTPATDARVNQWVLQQSDLVPVPSAPKQ